METGMKIKLQVYNYTYSRDGDKKNSAPISRRQLPVFACLEIKYRTLVTIGLRGYDSLRRTECDN